MIFDDFQKVPAHWEGTAAVSATAAAVGAAKAAVGAKVAAGGAPAAACPVHGNVKLISQKNDH